MDLELNSEELAVRQLEDRELERLVARKDRYLDIQRLNLSYLERLAAALAKDPRDKDIETVFIERIKAKTPVEIKESNEKFRNLKAKATNPRAVDHVLSDIDALKAEFEGITNVETLEAVIEEYKDRVTRDRAARLERMREDLEGKPTRLPPKPLPVEQKKVVYDLNLPELQNYVTLAHYAYDIVKTKDAAQKAELKRKYTELDKFVKEQERNETKHFMSVISADMANEPKDSARYPLMVAEYEKYKQGKFYKQRYDAIRTQVFELRHTQDEAAKAAAAAETKVDPRAAEIAELTQLIDKALIYERNYFNDKVSLEDKYSELGKLWEKYMVMKEKLDCARSAYASMLKLRDCNKMTKEEKEEHKHYTVMLGYITYIKTFYRKLIDYSNYMYSVEGERNASRLNFGKVREYYDTLKKMVDTLDYNTQTLEVEKFMKQQQKRNEYLKDQEYREKMVMFVQGLRYSNDYAVNNKDKKVMDKIVEQYTTFAESQRNNRVEDIGINYKWSSKLNFIADMIKDMIEQMTEKNNMSSNPIDISKDIEKLNMIMKYIENEDNLRNYRLDLQAYNRDPRHKEKEPPRLPEINIVDLPAVYLAYDYVFLPYRYKYKGCSGEGTLTCRLALETARYNIRRDMCKYLMQAIVENNVTQKLSVDVFNKLKAELTRTMRQILWHVEVAEVSKIIAEMKQLTMKWVNHIYDKVAILKKNHFFLDNPIIEKQLDESEKDFKPDDRGLALFGILTKELRDETMKDPENRKKFIDKLNSIDPELYVGTRRARRTVEILESIDEDFKNNVFKKNDIRKLYNFTQNFIRQQSMQPKFKKDFISKDTQELLNMRSNEELKAEILKRKAERPKTEKEMLLHQISSLLEGKAKPIEVSKDIYGLVNVLHPEQQQFKILSDYHVGVVTNWLQNKNKNKNGILEDVNINEIEASLGTYYIPRYRVKRDDTGRVIDYMKGEFRSGVKDLRAFDNIRRKLIDAKFNSNITSDIVHIITDPATGKQHRRITTKDGKVTLENKQRIANFGINLWGYNIKASSEQPSDITSETFQDILSNAEISFTNIGSGILAKDNYDSSKVLYTVRKRERTSFVGDGIYEGIVFDLTFVKTVTYRSTGRKAKVRTAEVEIEIQKDTGVSPKDLVENFESALKFVYGGYVLAKDELTANFPQDELNFVKVYYDALTQGYNITESNNERKHDPLFLQSFLVKPINIKMESILYSMDNNNETLSATKGKSSQLAKRLEHIPTIKINGTRCMLLLTDYGMYFLDPPYTYSKVRSYNKKYRPSFTSTLIDGEYCEMNNTYYAFDMLFYRGKNVMSWDFEARYQKLLETKDAVSFTNGITYTVKEYFTSGWDIFDKCAKAIEAAKAMEEVNKNITDGLILTSAYGYSDKGLYALKCYKWKPPRHLTIDFLLKRYRGKELQMLKESIMKEKGMSSIPDNLIFYKLLTLGDSKGEKVIFKGSKTTKFRGFLVSKDNVKVDGYTDIDGKVVECIYMKPAATDSNPNPKPEDGSFYPIRIRFDRAGQPNKNRVAEDVWDDIINPISEETITGNDFTLLRRYHNNVKRSLINHWFDEGDSLLDIGSGRLGDLNKWMKKGLRKVIAVDPNEENMAEAEKRLKQAGANASGTVKLMKCGAQETDKLMTDIATVNGVTAFFSLTYFPESPEMFNGLLKTLSYMPVGSKLVGVVLDGDAVKKLLDMARAANNTPADEVAVYSTSAFSIREASVGSNKIITNIAEESAMVKDLREWMFPFETFKSGLEKLGFVLDKSYMLDHGKFYNRLPKASKAFSALNRVFIFHRAQFVEKVATIGIRKITKHAYLPMPKGADNIIHSILYATSDKFKLMSKDERETNVNTVRQNIIKACTPEYFESLQISKLLKVINNGDEQKAYQQFMSDLSNKKKWFNVEIAVKYISESSKVNIILMSGKLLNKEVVIKSKDANCSTVSGRTSTVVLITLDDVNYGIMVGKKGDEELKYVYSESDKIQTVLKPFCK